MRKFVRLALATAAMMALTAPRAAIAGQQSPPTVPLPVEKSATFYRDVLPILQQHCQVCHRQGEIGPTPLTTYEEVSPFARAIATATSTKKMPPWFADPAVGHFSNDPSLSPQEIAT